MKIELNKLKTIDDYQSVIEKLEPDEYRDFLRLPTDKRMKIVEFIFKYSNIFESL